MSILHASTTGFRVTGPACDDRRPHVLAARIPLAPLHAIHPGDWAALCGVEVIDLDRPWRAGPGVWCLECVALTAHDSAEQTDL